jgi:hypothetical protein
MEAFLIRRRTSLAICLRIRALGLIRNIFLPFALGRHPTLPLFLLLLNHHHMIGVFLNAILSYFKCVMSLSHDLLRVIHMKIHNEQLITCWERLENHVTSQVILELETKFVQGLNVTHHLDCMRTDRATSQPLLGSQISHAAPKS